MQVLRLCLVLALCTACAPAHVVNTPASIPLSGSRVRYAMRPDTSEFVSARLISLDADSLVLERLIPGDRDGRWVAATGLLPTRPPGR